jgi:hypothetical protein
MTIEEYLGDKADQLLNFKNPKIPKERLHLPGPDFVDRIFASTDRNNRVLVNLQRLFQTGQANHLGVTLQADIIKQKLPENNAGYKALNAIQDVYLSPQVTVA